MLNKELEYIENNQIRKFTKLAIDNLPDYFFNVAASSTGKYHPGYALGEGGLVRHTKAAARFANHLLQLDQNKEKFDEIERSCIISAIILHDGWKHGNNGSSFTTHEHPQVCADWILTSELFKELRQREKEIIASAIASHMGQWNTTKRSSLVLQKPVTDIQQFVHMCDYLASRKDIEILFDGVVQNEGSSQKEVKLEDYRFTFGKYNGQLITDVAKDHLDYLQWMKGNMSLKEPLKTFVAQLVG